MKKAQNSLKVAIAGHSLCTWENRAPFTNINSMHIRLWAPQRWRAKTLGKLFETESLPQLSTCPVALGGHNSLFWWRGIQSSLLAFRPDILYAWEEPWSLAAWQLSRISGKLDKPFLFYSAEQMPKRLPPPFKIIRRQVYRQSTGAIAITREVENRLLSTGFTKPIYRIPLGIYPFPRAETSPETKNLLYIGRLIPLKRISLLIRVLVQLPEYRLVIIGDGPEKNNLFQLSKRLKVHSRVQFMGWMENRLLHSVIKTCSLGIIPTASNSARAEQFGKAAIEMALCGLPVLASASGNFLELAKKCSTIQTCEVSDISELARRIKHIHRQYPTLKERIKNRQLLLKDFSLEAVSKRYRQAFLDCHKTWNQSNSPHGL